MSGPEMLAEARAAGMTIWRDGDTLAYRGPPEAIAELLPRLKAHKADILEALDFELLDQAIDGLCDRRGDPDWNRQALKADVRDPSLVPAGLRGWFCCAFSLRRCGSSAAAPAPRSRSLTFGRRRAARTGICRAVLSSLPQSPANGVDDRTLRPEVEGAPVSRRRRKMSLTENRLYNPSQRDTLPQPKVFYTRAFGDSLPGSSALPFTASFLKLSPNTRCSHWSKT